MQVSVESTGNLERRVILSLPAGDVEAQIGSRLREIAHNVRIKGFRPGKVPTKVVEQRYGGQVRAEIVDGLLRQGLDLSLIHIYPRMRVGNMQIAAVFCATALRSFAHAAGG